MQGIGRRDDLRIPYPGLEALIGRGFNHATTAQNVGGKNRYDDPRFQRPAGTGEERRLTDYRGKVLLIVNVASKCGFTPQYNGLQSLYEQFQPRGFEILAFPCDQFGHQEPGSDAEIATFCDATYGVTFPLFAKIEVNGKNAHPLYVWLR